jgi:membrane protease YdiL (CAAX protease family)
VEDKWLKVCPLVFWYRQMNTDEHEAMESASAKADTADAGQPVTGRRGAVLGILIAALIFAEFAKDLAFSAAPREWLSAWNILYYALIAGFPFLLAKLAPGAASFDTQWLPRSRWHWVWFFGMLFLAFVAAVLVSALAAAILGHPPPRAFTGPVTPRGIVLQGVAMVLVGPIAEEIFFRGYVLEQLRKLARSSVALLIHSLLFASWHLYTWGLFSSIAVLNSVFAFFFGMILGGWRIRFKSLLPLLLAHILFNATAIPWLEARYDWAVLKSDPSNAKCPTISRETTYITEPLRKDGYPDYVAALNRRFSQGVTPENNSAVLFWKAMGPSEILADHRKKYFQMLGVPPLPEKGDYFVSLEQYLAKQKGSAKPGDARPAPGAKDNAYDLSDPAVRRPWTKQQFPLLAKWLAANEKPLALLVEASKRPRRYDPLVGPPNVSLIAVLQPAIGAFHSSGGIVDALTARAMLRLSAAKVEESWEDLLTRHRLARLVGQGPTLTDTLFANLLDGQACLCDQALLEQASPTAGGIAKMREDLDRLPPMPSAAERIDVAERFEYLSVVLDYSRQGKASLADIKSGAQMELVGAKELSRVIEALARYSAKTATNWDLPLRAGNSWYDRIAAAYRKPTWAARREALRNIDADFHKLRAMAGDVASLDESMRVDPVRAFSERLGQVILVMFWPSPSVEFDLEATPAMTFELTRLAFVLAAYRADHGSYPRQLANLAPRYVRELPKDIFNDAELHYRQEGKGYCLYSVGRNGRDDGGRGVENGRQTDESVKKGWDDLVIRMPGAAKQQTR